MTTGGKIEYLDVLMATLNPACDGQATRWYESTLELQRASRAFCEACRSFQTLHVRIDGRTPPSLWSPASSRVPAVQAFGMTWVLGCSSAERRGSLLLQQRLKRLAINLDTPLDTTSWPIALEQLSFGNGFNQPIAGVEWPVSLRQLSFGERFNQPIVDVEWPVSLQQLSFGDYFDQPIVGVVWPVF
ncbi:unnamed protein product, partial [Ectocarpus sp. 6 AP-2014]